MGRRRATRRFWVRPYILRRGGVSLGTSDAFPSFWEAYLSSDVAKIKNTAILNAFLSVISALKLNAGQRWGSFLWLARTRTKLADRQLVHCRIDVVTNRTNVVVNPSYLAQKSQATRALSYRCRDYSKKYPSKPVISRHYTALCRSKSYMTRHNSHYVAMVDRRPRTRENLRQ